MSAHHEPARHEGPGSVEQPGRASALGRSSAAAEASWENEGGHVLRDLRAATRVTLSEGDGKTERSGVRVGRVYEKRTPRSGARVLVDRVWPRGMAKDAADLDEWCKGVAPSTALRRWYGHEPSRFDEFARRYRAELDHPGPAAALRHLRDLAGRQSLTLLTATRQPEISQAAVLASLLDPENSAGR